LHEEKNYLMLADRPGGHRCPSETAKEKVKEFSSSQLKQARRGLKPS